MSLNSVKAESEVQELVIEDGSWYRVWRGPTSFTVYRSIRLDETSFTYQPVMELVRGLNPVIVGRYDDPRMMGHGAELLFYSF